MRHLATIALALGIAIAGAATAPAAFAAPAYEMSFAPPPLAGSPSVFRIAVATGQVMSVGNQLASTTDAAPLPPGDYHLFLMETPDQKTFWLYRMDSQSGRVWFLSNNTWTEVTASK